MTMKLRRLPGLLGIGGVLACTVLAVGGCAGSPEPHAVSDVTTTADAWESELSLQGKSLQEWRTLITPKPEERAWEQIPWLPTFHQGLEQASAEGKPLLLWLMNGHPLGCT